MNIAGLSIRQPILISSIVIGIITVGIISFTRLGVDLLPDVSPPIVTVTIIYPGSTPDELENIVAKPLEDSISVIAGIKHFTTSISEGVSVTVIEFNLGVDLMNAEQEVRNKVSSARRDLPSDIEEPVIERLNPNDAPVIRYALTADLPADEIYDLAKETIQPMIFKVNNVGDMAIVGGAKKEIQVELDRDLLNRYLVPAVVVAEQIKNNGVNMPIGKFELGESEESFRAMGRFESLDQISNSLISFSGDINNSISLRTLGRTSVGREDPRTIAWLYYPFNSQGPGGETDRGSGAVREKRPCLFLDIRKQSGANTVQVAQGVRIRMNEINRSLATARGGPRLIPVYDLSKFIEINVTEATVTIYIGILLAVIVIFLFLGTARATLIAAIAIPSSLLGAIIMLRVFDFTLNVVTLIALSLTVGLLVDDAIVVIENIHRRIEERLKPSVAAEEGTQQVMLAVVATTISIVAVFLPVAFIGGILGRYLEQFGLTVVFAMIVSLFIAVTATPMLSAYFIGSGSRGKSFFTKLSGRLQDLSDRKYAVISMWSVDHPLIIIIIATAVFAGSIATVKHVKQTMMSEAHLAEFNINVELAPGTSLEGMTSVAEKIEERIRNIPELDYITTVIGTAQGESNMATIGVFFLPAKKRSRTAEELLVVLREIMSGEFSYIKTRVSSNKPELSADTSPFTMYIKGTDAAVLNDYAMKLIPRISSIPDMTNVDTNIRSGRPELQVVMDGSVLNRFGVLQKTASAELRYHVAGVVVGTLHEKGLEYDVRMRLKWDQRNIKTAYNAIRVPNIHGKMVYLNAVSRLVETSSPSSILRQDKNHVVKIIANMSEGGGLGNAIKQAESVIKNEIPLPAGVSYSFSGESEYFGELMRGFTLAMVIALIFLYLVLASLYESFITPVTIMIAIPPAISGGIYSLFITGKMLDMLGVVGLISLVGLVTKNSILLVDFAVKRIRSGRGRRDAILEAGRLRLRPILMTTFAMIAGMIPVAMGFGEAARMRQSMGVTIIGGLIISTLITLLMVPAIFQYVDMFREFIERHFRIDEEDTPGDEGIHIEGTVKPGNTDSLAEPGVTGSAVTPAHSVNRSEKKIKHRWHLREP